MRLVSSSPDQLSIEVGGFPTAIRPMQAEPAEAPFSNNEYLFEVKWDGLRCLLFVGPDGAVRLQDRALREVTYQFPEFGNLGGQVPPGTVLDGALVVTDGEGRPETGALRRRLAGPAGEDQRPAAYLAFDLLYLEGRPMLRKPLYQRKKHSTRWWVRVATSTPRSTSRRRAWSSTKPVSSRVSRG